jgi:hypothetical protein
MEHIIVSHSKQTESLPFGKEEKPPKFKKIKIIK